LHTLQELIVCSLQQEGVDLLVELLAEVSQRLGATER